VGPIHIGFDAQILRRQRRGGISRYFYGGRPYRLRQGQRLVSSLFDMVPERHPEHFFLPGLRSPHANKSAWLSASDLIISISAASADDLEFFHPELRTPVQVIHLARPWTASVPNRWQGCATVASG